jgi:hypothetical protein
MQIYELRHQCYPFFHDYLIDSEDFDNLLLRFVDAYDESTNTAFYKEMIGGIMYNNM